MLLPGGRIRGVGVQPNARSSVSHQRSTVGGDGPAQLVDYLRSVGARDQRLLHVEQIPGRTATTAPWPDFINPEVVGAFSAGGASAL